MVRRFRIPAVLVLALLVASFAPMAAHAADTVTVTNATTTFNDPVTLQATYIFTDSFECPGGCPNSGLQMDFFIDGTYVGSAITDHAGIARLIVTPAQDVHVGTHQIKASHDHGTVPVTAASGTGTLTITKDATTMTAHRGYFEAQLLDDENAPISGAAVHFHVTGPDGAEHDVCNAFTDAAGNARCVPVTGAGLTITDVSQTHYTATFDGTGDYSGSSDGADFID